MMPDDLENPVTVAALVRAGALRLGGGAARREAELLLELALEVDRAWLFAHPEAQPEAAARARFEALLARRAAGEPLAYVRGRAGFWTLELAVGPATLIPRPETELLVEAALARLAPDMPWRVADLGTGSGAIALALACERPRIEVLATDASPAALEQAEANARRLGIDHVAFARGHWCQALGGARFDLIVSNPPYIAASDPHLAQGDLRFEPRTALVSGADGLEAIGCILAEAPAHLEDGGWVLLEHGWEQGEAVRELLHRHGFAAVETLRDLEGRERVSLGQKPGFRAALR